MAHWRNQLKVKHDGSVDLRCLRPISRKWQKRRVVYRLRNTVNNKIYIGSAEFYTQRKAQHLSELRNGKHNNSYLQRAWNKYGASAFKWKVLEEVSDDVDILEREQYWLDKTKCYERSIGYNLALFAKSPMKGRTHSEKSRKAMSNARRGVKFGPRTAEQKKRMSTAALNRRHQPVGAQQSNVKCYIVTHIETGVKHFIEGISEFCRQNGLNQGSLCSIARGESRQGKQHHGYTAKEISKIKYNRLRRV